MVNLYRSGLRPLLFSALKADPEALHQRFMQTCAWLNTHPQAAAWGQHQLQQWFSMAAPPLHQTLWGLDFPNPIGLAAGFDKNGVASNVWPSFGFGFAEVGTVTHHAQPGNPRPRLFRLPQDLAAINRMGFNNDGAAQMAEVLAQARGSRSATPLGINLGKSKVTPLEAAATDYLASFRLLKNYGDYFVVNVSSPNTPGLRSLQAVAQLEPILAALQTENEGTKPLLVKIAPDLAWDDIEAIVTLAQTYQLAGIIATNTTINKQGLRTQRLAVTGNPPAEEAGGLSGAPVRKRATEVIRFIWQQTQGQLPIVGVGGIFTAADAWEKITAGACLLQVYTGWTYEGPGMIKSILTGLMTQLQAHGYERLEDAIALDHRLQKS